MSVLIEAPGKKLLIGSPYVPHKPYGYQTGSSGSDVGTSANRAAGIVGVPRGRRFGDLYFLPYEEEEIVSTNSIPNSQKPLIVQTTQNPIPSVQSIPSLQNPSEVASTTASTSREIDPLLPSRRKFPFSDRNISANFRSYHYIVPLSSLLTSAGEAENATLAGLGWDPHALAPIFSPVEIARFKRSKAWFTSLLFLGCLSYILVFSFGVVNNTQNSNQAYDLSSSETASSSNSTNHILKNISAGNTTSNWEYMSNSMLTSTNIGVATSYLILYILLDGLALMGTIMHNVNLLTLYLTVQIVIVIISAFNAIRPFLVFKAAVIIIGAQVRRGILKIDEAERYFQQQMESMGITVDDLLNELNSNSGNNNATDRNGERRNGPDNTTAAARVTLSSELHGARSGTGISEGNDGLPSYPARDNNSSTELSGTSNGTTATATPRVGQ